MNIMQLNTAEEYGRQPQQQNRFYSIHGGGVLAVNVRRPNNESTIAI
jgi:hypothetical protein